MSKTMQMFFVSALAIAVVATYGTRLSLADDWTMNITVDNQYAIYFGDAFLTVPTSVGGDGNWTTTETWTITGVSPTAYLYVATASDHNVAQGFLGSFTNITTSTTYDTSDDTSSPWEVFPAGQYLAALNALDGTIPATTWPISVQPTMSQVQTAVNYATTNNLWVNPTSVPGYDNSSSPSPWGNRPGIPATAEWIWHDTGTGTSIPYPAPFDGFNHDEFLVFRVPGVVPEPGSAALLVVASSMFGLVRRTRRELP